MRANGVVDKAPRKREKKGRERERERRRERNAGSDKKSNDFL